MPARPIDVSAGFFHRSGNLKPPAGLPEGAEKLWQEIMRGSPRDQWRAADVPLLSMFVRVSVLADEAVRALEEGGQVDAGGRVSPWGRVAADHSKTLALLASKLRLAPSARIRAEAHSLQQRPAFSKPWLRDDPDDDDPDNLLAR